MSDPSPVILQYASPSVRLHGWLDTLGWAAYLGCSWTWCIGMFLPVLLIRDYGVAGWWAFAIPNVVGAAAMGWVVPSKGHSEQLVLAHRPAIRVFSIVTVSFHVFFIYWIMSELGGLDRAPWWAHRAANGTLSLLWPAILFLPFLAIYGASKGRADRIAALAVLSISVGIALIGAKAGLLFKLYDGLGNGPIGYWQRALIQNLTPPVAAAQRPNLIYLTPVMIFGFLLCPYLDQTFHRARQRSAHPRQAFVIGFGFFFAAMIVMTLGYSVWLYGRHAPLAVWMYPAIAAIPLGALLWVHLMIQSGITMSLHLRDSTRADGRELSLPTMIALLLAYFAGICAALPSLNEEAAYRMFMGFYALVFPAYVLICIKPWRKVTAAPGARQWIFFAGAVSLAGPFFLMGITGENRLPMFCGLLVVLVTAGAERVLPASRRQPL